MRNRLFRLFLSLSIVFSFSAMPLAASAQTDFTVNVEATASCQTVTFSLEVVGGEGDYDATFDFGDGNTEYETFSGSTFEYEYDYPEAGSYDWMVTVHNTSDDTSGFTTGSVQVGPQVTLMSEPFPPVLTLENGSASADFTAQVENGQDPLTFDWDLDGNGTTDEGASASSATASFEYTAAGKYNASVEVTDNCDLSAQDTLPVVVFDPEDACHPRAQQIAEAVSSLFPGQSDDTYSCEDIFGIFNGDLTGDQLGFGRMWHAYQLAASLEELTWQEILDWHLNEGGWGLLTQLDRYAEALDEIGLRDLTGMVLNGEATINEIRTAVRSVVKDEADFEDALARLQAGATPGELGQFYRLAGDLDLEPSELDAYLDEGLSLPEIKHLGSLSTRFGADLTELSEARSNGASWGDLNQAYRLADDETSAAEILETGVKEYRAQQRQNDQYERTADRLVEQYGVDRSTVDDAYDDCDGNWGCVRRQLREQNQTSAQSTGQTSRDERTAQRLIDQYGASETQVWSLFNGTCSGDWSCVRSELRDAYPRGRGNNK